MHKLRVSKNYGRNGGWVVRIPSPTPGWFLFFPFQTFEKALHWAVTEACTPEFRKGIVWHG